MNLQRLKFAHARGARIQEYGAHESHDGMRWIDVAWFPRTGYQNYRVHPDDEHLQYGALSSALRESVIYGETHPAFHGATGVLVAMFPKLQKEWWDLDGDARRMQFLFLAELLADEGL